MPGLIAVHQDATGKAQRASRWPTPRASAAPRAGVIETTFEEETETDLFGEQAVLCGGVTALVKAGFETLVEAGYQPEIAYFECLHELKLIVDLMYEGGIAVHALLASATPPSTATTPAARAIIDDNVRETMREILAEIQNGEFAREWILENQAGRPVLQRAASARARSTSSRPSARSCAA